MLAGIYATFRSWRAVLADLGGGLPQASATRVFYLGQLGKYLPGTVWPAVTQMPRPRLPGPAASLGRGLRSSAPARRHRPAGRAAGDPLLGLDAADEYRWLALVVPLFALAPPPPLLNLVIAVALRAARRPPMPAPLTPGGVLRGAGWAVGSWVWHSGQVYLLARTLGAGAGRCCGCSARARSRPPSSAASCCWSPGRGRDP